MSEWEMLVLLVGLIGVGMLDLYYRQWLKRLERRLNHANAMRESMSNQVARLECKLVRLTQRFERIGGKDGKR